MVASQRSAAAGVIAGVIRAWDDTGVRVSRIPWLVTVLICAVAALLLLVSGYQGYAAVVLAVGASAAINLR
jgi:hypothetical protein